MNKKGIEMSVGMIVLIILSILIFSMSVYFLFNWFGEAQQLQEHIDRRTQEQILSLLKSGNHLVAIPLSVQNTQRGGAVTFGVGIRNILDSSQFSIAVNYAGAYNPDGTINSDVEPAHINSKWLGNFRTVPSFTLAKNQQDVKAVLINADVNTAIGRPTQKGDYVFNVCVYRNTLNTVSCDVETYKSDPTQYYTEKIYQVTVRVV